MTEAGPRCPACGIELAPGLLACPGCRKLVHADRLKALAAEAEEAERDGRLADAVTRWRSALPLLPRESTQAAAVTETVRRLSVAIDKAGGAASDAKGGGTGKAAGLGALGLMVWKLKAVLFSFLAKAKLLATGLTSLPTLLSMGAWLAIDRRDGALLALGIMLSIYVHEMGHVWALRRFGIEASAPMFVPGLGALVRLRQYPVDAREDARAGLAGPVWGCAASAVALALGLLVHQPVLLRVASFGATINVFNLIPFWQLDGARGFRALDAKQRGIVLAIAAAAALVLSQPLGWVVCAIGAFRIKSDVPSEGDATAFRTFTGLLVVLSFFAWAGAPRP